VRRGRDALRLYDHIADSPFLAKFKSWSSDYVEQRSRAITGGPPMWCGTNEHRALCELQPVDHDDVHVVSPVGGLSCLSVCASLRAASACLVDYNPVQVEYATQALAAAASASSPDAWVIDMLKWLTARGAVLRGNTLNCGRLDCDIHYESQARHSSFRLGHGWLAQEGYDHVRQMIAGESITPRTGDLVRDARALEAACRQDAYNVLWWSNLDLYYGAAVLDNAADHLTARGFRGVILPQDRPFGATDREAETSAQARGEITVGE